ncbi:MAG: penicillin-binding protein 1A [Burkholderiaceae bacterium]
MSDSENGGSTPRWLQRLSARFAGLHPAVRWPIAIVSTAFGLVFALGFSALVLAAIALSVAYPNLPEISSLADYRPKLPMRIYSADDVLIGEYGEERRQFAPISEIPKVMREAVLAIEDARFYQHGGVDYIGIVRAGLANVGESRSQGASTITMQVARNFYLPTEKTLSRKLYEILLALKIERQLTKDQILEVYMNQIFLGQRAYGFAAASEIYFGKHLRDIDAAEAAMLAGLPKAPSSFNPIANPKRARARQQYIIDRMVENGFLTQEQAEAARTEKLVYRRSIQVPLHAEHVAETARQLIFSQYGDSAYTRGLHVHTSVSATEQETAYRALRKGITDYERRQVYRGPEAYIDLPADPKAIDARIADALDEHPDNDEIKAAVVLEASPKQVVASLHSGDTLTIVGEGLKPATSGLAPKGNPKTAIRPGAVIRVIATGKDKAGKEQWSITQVPEVEGAFVSMDPRTGAIRSMVGGFDNSKSQFNRVTQAWRQPGSSFKPFIYSAALEKGFSPATVINDAPLFFDAAATGSQPWEPKNYDGTFDGPMSMRRALAKSKNMVSIRIVEAIGTAYAQKWITRFGFDADKHLPYLPMALGTGSVTPLQMASAYSVFANGGYRVNPILVTKITDDKGRIVTQVEPPALDETTRTIDARNAFVMSSLLQEVARSGTAARAQATLKRADIYGKTGTTNDSQDTWFAGFTKNLVGIVWIGYDQPRKLGDRETGGGLSLPVWIDYMSFALKNVKPDEIKPPSEGLLNVGGEWYYEESGPGHGVASLGLDVQAPPQATEDERKGILDLFKN